MNERYKDTDLREALRRKYAETPKLPADFMTKIRQQTEPEPARKVTLWRWVAAAACLIIIIGIGVTIFPLGDTKGSGTFVSKRTDENLTAKQGKSESGAYSPTVRPARTVSPGSPDAQSAQPGLVVQTVRTNTPKAPKVQTAPMKAPAQLGVKSITADESPAQTLLPTENLHYAAYSPAEDSTYQAPSRMDEFIAKLADYHQAKAVPLDCASDKSDTTIISTAYVFEDRQDIDLFGRLLQAACWYDSKTPGYLLNFSRQQFFFCLNDLRKGKKYFWIAEHISGNRVLLFSSHSPIEATVSSACFQEYREQLTHTKI